MTGCVGHTSTLRQTALRYGPWPFERCAVVDQDLCVRQVVWWQVLSALDPRLNTVDRVGGVDVELDLLARERGNLEELCTPWLATPTTAGCARTTGERTILWSPTAW